MCRRRRAHGSRSASRRPPGSGAARREMTATTEGGRRSGRARAVLGRSATGARADRSRPLRESSGRPPYGGDPPLLGGGGVRRAEERAHVREARGREERVPPGHVEERAVTFAREALLAVTARVRREDHAAGNERAPELAEHARKIASASGRATRWRRCRRRPPPGDRARGSSGGAPAPAARAPSRRSAPSRRAPWAGPRAASATRSRPGLQPRSSTRKGACPRGP